MRARDDGAPAGRRAPRVTSSDPADPDADPVDARRRALAGTFLVLGAATLWATFGIFAKRLYAEGFQPGELASVRAFIAFLAVLGFAAATRGSVRVGRRTAGFLAIYGVVGFAVFQLVYLGSLERTPVAVAAALLYTAPAFVVVIARFTLGESLDGEKLALLGLVLVGVLLVTGMRREITGTGGEALSPTAIGLGLGAGLTYAIYTVMSKAAMQRTGPLPALTWSFGAATVALAFVASPIEPLLRSRAALPWLIGLGIVPTLLAYALFLRALRLLRAGAASMIASVEPVIAAGLAVLVLGETLHAEQGAGIACIVLAAILTERRAARRG